ncbi:MAG: hypothetical protein RL199_52 [Pseudomonadota bacterium]|jgi:hypothetical protein
MTLTTSTTHADLTITATLNTETRKVSYDVDGIWAGDGKWTNLRGGSTIDCGALLVRDNDDATDEVYDALDAGLRAQLAAQPAHDDCDTVGARELDCRACAARIVVRDCDLCPACGEVPSHYHCGDRRPIPSRLA